jgi:Leucine-rich repeat (LRR) protein
MIETIEGLDNNLEMHTLNLESNIVRKIENVNHLKKLEGLWVKSNRIGLNGKSDFE